MFIKISYRGSNRSVVAKVTTELEPKYVLGRNTPQRWEGLHMGGIPSQWSLGNYGRVIAPPKRVTTLAEYMKKEGHW